MTKVLLVEDDKSLREIYAVRLVEEGYDIVSAGDGEEALAMAIKERPGLIISDVMMPKISGFDMLDILRSTTETKDIKVIMMTALSSEDQRERGVSLGADRYLVKSQVGIEDVVRTVHEVLADAPVAGQTPLMTSSAPTPVAPPIVAGPGAQAAIPVTPPASNAAPATPADPAPVSQPPAQPSVPPRVAPAPVQSVTPVTSPAPAAPASPTSAPVVAPTATPNPTPSTDSALPQPTAPFSTPRTGTLATRVIEPLAPSEATATPNISTMMEKELSGSTIPPQPTPEVPTPSVQPAATAIATPPIPPVPPIPVAPVDTTPTDLTFEETPRPPAGLSTPPQASSQPPTTPGTV